MERGDDVGRGERGDYVNEMEKVQGFAAVELLPVVLPRSLPAASPPPRLSLALPLCRMSDPVSAAPLPAWERHEALRHKQNTDKNTRRAMCRPVSQDSPNSLSLSVSPFSIHLSLSFIHTHRVQTKSQQSAGHHRCSSSCQYYHSRLITWVQWMVLWRFCWAQ